MVVALLATTTCRSAEHHPRISSRAPTPVASVARSDAPLAPIDSASLCVSSGRVDSPGARRFHIDAGGVRAVVAGDHGTAAEIAFIYRGPSSTPVPLANGELRRQIGVKLRARDTCNVVYVMWHIAPSSGIFVSVKHNAGASTHRECGASGYINVKPESSTPPSLIERDDLHRLRADLRGGVLEVMADDVLVWRGRLPSEAFAFDGPAGLRTDNGIFDLELRVPGGAASSCTSR